MITLNQQTRPEYARHEVVGSIRGCLRKHAGFLNSGEKIPGLLTRLPGEQQRPHLRDCRCGLDYSRHRIVVLAQGNWRTHVGLCHPGEIWEYLYVILEREQVGGDELAQSRCCIQVSLFSQAQRPWLNLSLIGRHWLQQIQKCSSLV